MNSFIRSGAVQHITYCALATLMGVMLVDKFFPTMGHFVPIVVLALGVGYEFWQVTRKPTWDKLDIADVFSDAAGCALAWLYYYVVINSVF